MRLPSAASREVQGARGRVTLGLRTRPSERRFKDREGRNERGPETIVAGILQLSAPE